MTTPDLPRIDPRVLSLFQRYLRWYLPRHFHAVLLARDGMEGLQRIEGRPLVVYLNHPSWWDPLVCLLLADELFDDRRSFGPVDAGAVERYGLLRRLGLFGVERGTTAGARRFLEVSSQLLSVPGVALWVTPQGRFADPRERPVELEGGLGHLARRLARSGERGASGCTFLPLAVEYPFWEESRPEVLLRFGQPATVEDLLAHGGSRQITRELARRLEGSQDALAGLARQRRWSGFRVLLSGGAGVGGVYDLWRRLKAWLGGERFRPEHGTGSANDATVWDPRDSEVER